MTEEIVALALQMGGKAEDEDVLWTLCQAAESQLARRLRDGVSPGHCGSAFSIAAACLALAGLYSVGRQESVESFTAGDVTIRNGGGSSQLRASALREQAERLMAPWVQDGGFCFQKVMG